MQPQKQLTVVLGVSKSLRELGTDLVSRLGSLSQDRFIIVEVLKIRREK